ncbi:thiosulfate oxidation carrier protein SoxY [Marivivens niveibacter]|uniref:Thiosulfate oxidation carrier protein SoxY n=1 Tax=Marivivens niveibacter TaxID=1930667 RepID=A0A251X2D7_9RHOB|nr:thiosulfate oxidation carrier protein SoxY [Marivivens niveibacter]OUD10484.1 thiosulfate oxidation carrier protein SoxY [Marivivens niveibacter]
MQITRRNTLLMTVGTAIAAAVPFKAMANADAAIDALLNGAEAGSEGLTLIAPEIAENGNTVPIEVNAPGATMIAVFAGGNPTPEVATFTFGPLAGSHSASTRMRLAGTQDVIAIAQMPDGSFVRASQEVKVTIGGCGG